MVLLNIFKIVLDLGYRVSFVRATSLFVASGGREGQDVTSDDTWPFWPRLSAILAIAAIAAIAGKCTRARVSSRETIFARACVFRRNRPPNLETRSLFCFSSATSYFICYSFF